MKQENPQLVRTKAAARALGLSPFFLYRNSKVFPGAHRAGKALRWDVAQLKSWMANQATKQSNEENDGPNSGLKEGGK